MEAVAETDMLINEAADWLIAKGEPLWGPNETSHDELVHVTKAGELITGRIAGELAACMYLHNEDKLFWPQDPPGQAFYIHRLAVARKYAGRGVAHAMLDWAAEETRRERRPYLRLDCEPRPKLLALYHSAGFTRVDEKPIEVIGHLVVRHEKLV
jgi:ribosomal protein S18 acetylase RimI-like enzyme